MRLVRLPCLRDEGRMERYARAPSWAWWRGTALEVRRIRWWCRMQIGMDWQARLVEYNRGEGLPRPVRRIVAAAAVATPRAEPCRPAPWKAVATVFLRRTPRFLRASSVGRAAPLSLLPCCSNVGTSLIPDVPMLISEGPMFELHPACRRIPGILGICPLMPRPAGQRQPCIPG